MKQLRSRRQKSLHVTSLTCNRRETDRLPVEFGLMYTAEGSKGKLIIGDGRVLDLSRTGLGIRGTAVVTPGMELTMFLYLPDGQDPLFTRAKCLFELRPFEDMNSLGISRVVKGIELLVGNHLDGR